MIRWPAHLERQLAARLRRRQRLLRQLLLEQLATISRMDGRADDARNDESWLGFAIRNIGARIRQAFGLSAPMTAESLMPTARAIDSNVTAAVAREVERNAPGFDTAPLVRQQLVDLQREWALEQAARIHAMEAAVIQRALAAAELAADTDLPILPAVTEALKSAEARAALAARDAVGALTARVGAARGPALGSTQFRWRSQGDSRVRDLHRQIDGRVYDWSSGHPTEGLPGQPWNCRCVAVPV